MYTNTWQITIDFLCVAGSNEAVKVTVELPDDTTISLEVLPTETIEVTKKRIEALRSCYPAEHQVLIHPGSLQLRPC